MKIMLLSVFKFLLLFIIMLNGPFISGANAQLSKEDWVGRFAMNHDGWEGTLVINQRDVRCLVNDPWCDLNGYYMDGKGNRYKLSIRRFSQNWRQITFLIHFPNNTQRFDGYLFSHDKKFVAGTTVWQNQRFGFYAKKIPNFKNLAHVTAIIADGNRYESVYDFKRRVVKPNTPPEDEIVGKKINEDGGVEILYKSGKKEIYSQGKVIIVMPNGETRMQMAIQVPDLVPPMPDQPDVNQWLEILNGNMDDIVSHLVGGDENSIANYENTLSEYAMVERINQGMKTISFLID